MDERYENSTACVEFGAQAEKSMCLFHNTAYHFFESYCQLQAQVVPVLCYFLRNSYGNEEPKNTC